ncbi:arylsulfatase [uncultured Sunxiuqinia sp.]|uniref:arylsulfatase n=1 Tax=uncultured Sunxiuqinia sp. TaxID=1573825 RepID=UPI00260F17DD|nr:arylsulfatase [uncultured Sunxiuqinia sp.]
MNQFVLSGLAALSALTACQSAKQGNEENKPAKPNIVYILADDLGYGDLSCYGQQKFQTPNIDRLASQGMLFTQHYSGTTVCAPSRSSLLTGMDTGHAPVRGNREVNPEGQYPIPETTFTLAKMLQEEGYTTGAFGKWGLGFPGSEGDPNKQGFDVFYGYNCQRLGHHYYPDHLWSNQEKVVLEENAGQARGVYAPNLIHQEALRFLEDNKEQPFFMYYPSIIPHAELFAPEEYMAKFRGKFDPERNYKGVDGGKGFRKGPYGSQPESHAAFAAMVTLLDDQVGEIMAKLEELGLADNTLVIFTSDNGPHKEGGADPDYFKSNGPLKGYKRDLYEGGIRVPMIASWPGKIQAGSQSDHVSAFWDMLPTFADMVGQKAPENIQGISLLPTLLGEDSQKEHDHLYWEFHEMGGRQAIRKGNWKYVTYHVFNAEKQTTELYDLSTDLGEEDNVADQHPDIVAEMQAILEEARVPSEAFPFGQNE